MTSAAPRVALGILCSRVLGLIRERVLAHFAGASATSDIFVAALRGPNLLQNLLGEQSLSAALIPIYSRFVEKGREEDARRFASTIGALLLIVASLAGLLGIVLAPMLVALLVPGWVGKPEIFGQAVMATRLVIPGTVALVLSAWCLTILNSHRRFFLPYFAPTFWNLAIIAGLVVGARFGLSTGTIGTRSGLHGLLLWGCIGVLIGGVLQLLVQLPMAASLMGGLRLRLDLSAAGVREALSAFAPVAGARGAVQFSAYLDMMLLSLLAQGAMSGGGYAQRLYLLAVALFGTAFAVVELPELSRLEGEGAVEGFQERLARAFSSIVFLTVPTTVGFVLFGHLIVGAVLLTGAFGAEANWLVYLLLAAYTVGLIPTTCGRVVQNAYYALNDTRTPAMIALFRVVVSTGVGLLLMLYLERFEVSEVIPVERSNALRLGAWGLAIASGVAGWLEWWALRRGLKGRLPAVALPWPRILRMGGLALLSALVAGALWWPLRGHHPLWLGPLVVGLYAAIYLSLAQVLGLTESRVFWQQARRRLPVTSRR